MPLTIEQTSNDPIPPYVWGFPAHLEPQPSLVTLHCETCISHIANSSSTEQFVQRFDACLRDNDLGCCKRCSQSKQTCFNVDPEFRRGVNVLVFLTEYARRKENALTSDSTEEQRVEVGAKYEKARGYAVKLNAALKDYRAWLKRQLKDKEMTRGAWDSARQASRECRPSNVVIDGRIESVFGRDGLAKNREKRFYYLGREIPSAAATPMLANTCSMYGMQLLHHEVEDPSLRPLSLGLK
ncbi:hypothetical protein BU24DRAFT_454997 [Aaosphaeria arxii CBS 175.79]|uniref:Uncharacterized protein n=1 Tax=Aaosphaeria arxii CBS 175.79 TaxID=1450172 RepID=A0A6A5XD15_9PLEO|nr:uncharacterized protein BU24DRAFT_454997 [Aaosphaeria arxii CBS 175.79]KAF2010697.1 hypothetical protein BU24DRAFT_454997 [Aaosphaeria arxii CBS 175.79]